jgi:hypothetical protein
LSDGFDFVDFLEGMHPGVQALFKFILFLVIVKEVSIYSRLLVALLFLLCLVWVYPDIKKIIITLMEAFK